MRRRAALHNPVMRAEAAGRFAAKNATARIQEPLLDKAAQGALENFAKAGFNGIVKRAPKQEIGRGTCWERVCQYVENSVVAGSLQKKQRLTSTHASEHK